MSIKLNMDEKIIKILMIKFQGRGESEMLISFTRFTKEL